MEDDKELIARLGGPRKLAERLGYERQGGVQRVQNWIVRGIPAKVKLARPDLFPIVNRRPAAVVVLAQTT